MDNHEQDRDQDRNQNLSEPAWEAMMERMLGAPIPVALGCHPLDLIPYAYVIPDGNGTVWHLDPACDGWWGSEPGDHGMPLGRDKFTDEPVLLTTLLPSDACAKNGWWPYLYPCWSAESGEWIHLDCSFERGGLVPQDDDDHIRWTRTLSPCGICVTLRGR